jgi:hypothetical protein
VHSFGNNASKATKNQMQHVIVEVTDRPYGVIFCSNLYLPLLDRGSLYNFCAHKKKERPQEHPKNQFEFFRWVQLADTLGVFALTSHGVLANTSKLCHSLVQQVLSTQNILKKVSN